MKKHKILSSHGELFTDENGKVLRVDLDECPECLAVGNTKTKCSIDSFNIAKYEEDFGQPAPDEIDILDLEWVNKAGGVHIPRCLTDHRNEKWL